MAIKKGVELGELTLDDLRVLSDKIDSDVFESSGAEANVGKKSQVGGTAPERVAEALASASKVTLITRPGRLP